MRDYGQACPVAMATEIFAERWTPLIIRELLRGKSRFNDLRRGLPRMSTALLSQRLRSLERDGVVTRRPDESGQGGEYRLTAAGQALGPVIEHLGMWGQLYVELRPTHADPGLLMQWIHEHLNLGELPGHRVVVHFTFPSISKNYWLILDAPETDLCFRNHGFSDDLLVTADAEALARVYLGRMELAEACRRRLITLQGPAELVTAFPAWIGLSGYARFARGEGVGHRFTR